jgi:hypothetical protein
MLMGIRVSADEEFEGLDIGEHGNRAYPTSRLTTPFTGRRPRRRRRRRTGWQPSSAVAK